MIHFVNCFNSALAAGSILYVVAFEILQRERSKMIRPKIAQFIAVLAGFAALMTVTLLSKTTLCYKYHTTEQSIFPLF